MILFASVLALIYLGACIYKVKQQINRLEKLQREYATQEPKTGPDGLQEF